MIRSIAGRNGAVAAVVLGAIAVAFSAERPPAALAARHIPFPTATYALQDVGAPSGAYTSFSPPLAFNATGQLVGQAYPAVPPVYAHCIAWTGSAWVDLNPPHSLNCYATSGISDANVQGVFATVGSTFVATSFSAVAFYAVVSPKSATLTTFAANAPSALYAMTAGGLATGFSYYAPFGGFSYYEPPFTSTGKTLDVVQPDCTAVKAGCMQPPLHFMVNGSLQGRSISADGTILAPAVLGSAGRYVEYAGGNRPKKVQFSLPLDAGDVLAGVRGMDDHGDVAYYEYDPKTTQNRAGLYDPAAKIVRRLGTLAGNSCASYVPLSINGPGRVLGVAESCLHSADQTYWTWDSANGLVAVAYRRNGYLSSRLTSINDKGEIAADLVTSGGKHHWGYLIAPAKL